MWYDGPEVIDMKDQAAVSAIIQELKELYPAAECSLPFDPDKAYELLFSVRLAAQCTDARVNMVTPVLYEKFPTLEFPMEELTNMLKVNVVSLMMCVKHFGAHMAKNNRGKIVIVSSVRGKIASRNDGNIGYCISKGAVDMLIRQAAADLGKYFVTVNGIGPTITETPMMTKIIEQRGGDAYRDQLASSLLIHRMATTDDCMGPALFLASPASDFVTGEIIYPTGGLTCCG